MPVERSAGAVIFRESSEGREYLLLHHQAIENKRVVKAVAGHWSFPKGHVEKGETTEETVRREVKEETGITKLEFVPEFKETIRYFVNYNGEKRMKFVAFFLCRTVEKKVTVSFEHQGFAWLPYEEAYETVTYPSDKKVLKATEDFLST
ncbi:MAG: NUDIX domain-containing protein [bacterium]|nr:NUDIX domain-containing protein [bacterium]MDZ4286256.1 NUDIX domain-containing protein [Candidatus Sungbacteria bacterium]